jgi:ElaB/YqjD/DUF883 family membrane-anchored ribosome-binding protein
MTEAINAIKTPDKFRDKLAETRDNIVDMGHIAKDAVQDKLHDLKEGAADKYEQGKEKLQSLEKTLERRVRESPMKSVLVAAGIGLALGIIWRRS